MDFALVNRVQPGDIVITQDYGLATMCLGPYTDPHFAGASKYMLTFCQACCPRLAIEVPLDDPLSRFRLAYWLDRGFVPAALAPSGRAISLLLHGE